jgi:hypothetical protein
VAPGVAPSSNVRSSVLSRLASADGYTVFDRDGRPIGKFIERTASGKEIAIRHDGLFLWHRRVLPLAAVASLSPGAIVLNLDRRAIKETSAAPTPVDAKPAAMTTATDEDQDWGARITRYIGVDEGDTDARTGTDEERKTEDIGLPATTKAERTSLKAGEDSETLAGPYLQFVSTPYGYHLLEQPGPAPAALDHVEVPEHDGLFRVVKLAISPLPNDSRRCAYLERIL